MPLRLLLGLAAGDLGGSLKGPDRSAEEEVEDQGAKHAARDLGGDVDGDVAPRESPERREHDGDGGVEMRSADRAGHDHHHRDGEAEGDAQLEQPVGARRDRRGDGHQTDRGQQEHGAELGQRPLPQS
jgi:hypothetical protein